MTTRSLPAAAALVALLALAVACCCMVAVEGKASACRKDSYVRDECYGNYTDVAGVLHCIARWAQVRGAGRGGVGGRAAGTTDWVRG